MARTDLVPAVTEIVLWKRVEGGGLRLTPWQWGFAVLAPLALIIIDLRLLGGWLLHLAPAAFWTAALLGPIPLALSQRRWGPTPDLVLNGMMVACMWLAVLAAVLPMLVFFFVGAFDWLTGATTFNDAMKSTLLSGISLLFTWPLFFTAAAYRRQAKLRIKRRPDLKTRPALIGMIVLPVVLLVVEATDRIWFEGVEAKLNSHNAASVLEAGKAIGGYPVGLMTKADEVCSALYAQRPGTNFETEALDERIDTAWGDRAGAIRTEARRLLGPDATATCADALSSGPF